MCVCVCVCLCDTGGWNTTDVTRVFARMAETSRTKVKEVKLSQLSLLSNDDESWELACDLSICAISNDL